jgi:hypothetical protein
VAVCARAVIVATAMAARNMRKPEAFRGVIEYLFQCAAVAERPLRLAIISPGMEHAPLAGGYV